MAGGSNRKRVPAWCREPCSRYESKQNHKGSLMALIRRKGSGGRRRRGQGYQAIRGSRVGRTAVLITLESAGSSGRSPASSSEAERTGAEQSEGRARSARRKRGEDVASRVLREPEKESGVRERNGGRQPHQITARRLTRAVCGEGPWRRALAPRDWARPPPAAQDCLCRRWGEAC